MHKDEYEALACLLFYGGKLRSSDRVMELSMKGGRLHAVVYEAKLNRLRLICEEHYKVWRRTKR